MSLAAARVELVARRALDDRARAATALGWYQTTRRFCQSLAEQFKVELWQVAGAVAALSPMQTWEEQLTYTPLVLQAHAKGLPLPGPGFNSNKRKAAEILDGRHATTVLKGDKVRAFFECIMYAGETDRVCVDRHAWAIAHGPDAAGLEITPRRYRDTVAAYVAAAAALRAAYPSLAEQLTPARVQSLTWVWWRDNTEARF